MNMGNIWITPRGSYGRLYADILKQPHTLIAGATGSGKSVCINGIVHAALKRSPDDVRFILIDPKRVELAAYADLPHTLAHAKGFAPEAWAQALQYAVDIMDARYNEMELKRKKMFPGADIYVVIDEWANVFKNGGRECYRAIMRLTSEGRAARVHVIMATQVPKACVLPTEVRENMIARLCLRCNSAVESRVLMDARGCETLPRYGKGYYITPERSACYDLPMIPEGELDAIVAHWMLQAERQRRPRRHLFNRAG